MEDFFVAQTISRKPTVIRLKSKERVAVRAQAAPGAGITYVFLVDGGYPSDQSNIPNVINLDGGLP